MKIILLLMIAIMVCSGCIYATNTSIDMILRPFGYECKDDSNYSGACGIEKVVKE